MNGKEHILQNRVSLEDSIDDWKDITALARKYPKASYWAYDTGYGLMDIYKDYAGFDNNYQPKINTIHGTFMGMKPRWWLNSEAGFKSIPAMFVNYETNKLMLESLIGEEKKFHLVQHPYHLILENYKNELQTERSGSILFLPHTLGFGKPFSIEFLVGELKKLPIQTGPIKICIHPNDINSESVALLRKDNYEIVCCGARYDPLFLHRFFRICNGVKYCLSIDLSTHTILSSLTGLEIISLFDRIPAISWVHGNYSLPNNRPDEEYWPILKEFYEGKINQDIFRNACFKVTGGMIKTSKQEFREMFENAEQLFISRKSKKGTLKMSCKDWTLIEPTIIKYRAYKKAIQNRLSGNNKFIQPVVPNLIYQLYRHYFSLEDNK
jgi:hypothetical protein